MKFYSIIIALLLSTVVATAQTSSTSAGQTVAMVERTVTDSYETSAPAEDADKLSITTDKRINAVKVLDEAGDVVISRSAQGGESVKFSLSSLKKGLYYLHVYCDGENIVRKFLKK